MLGLSLKFTTRISNAQKYNIKYWPLTLILYLFFYFLKELKKVSVIVPVFNIIFKDTAKADAW